MKSRNPYAAAFVVGSAIALLLSALAAVAPELTAVWLPLGGRGEFTQAAIVMMPLQAVAMIYDYFQR